MIDSCSPLNSISVFSFESQEGIATKQDVWTCSRGDGRALGERAQAAGRGNRGALCLSAHCGSADTFALTLPSSCNFGDCEQRLVKCRLRSEIEARKAVESTMKRAVKEARELKGELVLLRQEKEELRNELLARKHAVSAPGSDPKKTSGSSNNSDDTVTVAAAVKAAEKKFQQQLQKFTAENTELREKHERLEDERSALLQEKNAQLAQSEQELKKRAKDAAALEDELKKLRVVSEETKRKYQKMVKEKKEDLAKSLQENEHLARCKETLERQLELLPQLKKQLQYAKDKSSGVADDWQKKLELRDQAFLRQEDENKRQVTELQATIADLQEEKEQLHAQLDELTSKLYENEQRFEAKQRKQSEKFDNLVVTTKALQEKLVHALDELHDAQQVTQVAKETLAQESKLRQMADDAADAVEARALKLEAQLEQSAQQLERLEKALKTRGITFDFLLKAPSGASNNSKEREPQQQPEKKKREVSPEVSSSAPVKREPRATTSSSSSTTLKRSVSSASSAASREPATKAKATPAQPVAAALVKSKLALPQTTTPGNSSSMSTKLPVKSSATVPAKRIPLSHRSTAVTSSNNNDAERDGTPERTRRG